MIYNHYECPMSIIITAYNDVDHAKIVQIRVMNFFVKICSNYLTEHNEQML